MGLDIPHDSSPTASSKSLSVPTSSSSLQPSQDQPPPRIIQTSIAPPSSAFQAARAALTGFVKNIGFSKTSQDSPASAMKETLNTDKWNTKELSVRLAGDLAAAAAAGGLVAPLISIIDRGIIENASNRATLSASIRSSLRNLAFRPHVFLSSKPFLLVFALYGGTYLSANTLDSVTSTIKNKQASSVTSGTSKFVSTSAANLSLCLYKDSQFTRIFGAAASGSRGVPPISYGLFAVRDCLTVFASFNVPPVIAPMLPIGEEVEKYASRASVAQFLAPAAVQVFSTPLHLLGLDMYNRPRGEGVTTSSRAQRVIRDWGKSCAARICRIVPAFGVGGVVNTNVRAWWMKRLE